MIIPLDTNGYYRAELVETTDDAGDPMITVGFCAAGCLWDGSIDFATKIDAVNAVIEIAAEEYGIEYQLEDFREYLSTGLRTQITA